MKVSKLEVSLPLNPMVMPMQHTSPGPSTLRYPLHVARKYQKNDLNFTVANWSFKAMHIMAPALTAVRIDLSSENL